MDWASDQVRVDTYGQLIQLSNIANEVLENVIFGDDILRLEDEYIHHVSINTANRKKNLIMYNSLNEEERKAFNEIHSALSSSYQREEVTAILINMTPNDRKSFFLMCLAISFDGNVTYVAYLIILESRFEAVSGISAYTTHKFANRMSKLSFNDDQDIYHGMLQMIRDDIINPETVLGLLILDEYTTRCPLFLIWIYWIAKKLKVPVIYCGQKVGPKCMPLYKRSQFVEDIRNFNIVEILARPNIYFLSSANSEYERKVNIFRDILAQYRRSVPLTHNHKLVLALLFPQKFLMPEDLEAVYLAKFHADLRARARRITEKVPFVKSRYMHGNVNNMQPLHIEPDDKFLEYLPLIPGFLYKYTLRRGVDEIVTLLSIGKDLEYVTIKNSNNSKITVKRVSSDNLAIVWEEENWLKEHTESTIYQFPLRLLHETYASRQGLCFPESLKVELELKTNPLYSYPVTADDIYNGLKTVTTEDQLGLFHTEGLGNQLVYEVNELVDRDNPLEDQVNQLLHRDNPLEDQVNQLVLQDDNQLNDDNQLTEWMKIAMYLRDVPCDQIIDAASTTDSLKNHVRDFHARNREV